MDGGSGLGWLGPCDREGGTGREEWGTPFCCLFWPVMSLVCRLIIAGQERERKRRGEEEEKRAALDRFEERDRPEDKAWHGRVRLTSFDWLVCKIIHSTILVVAHPVPFFFLANCSSCFLVLVL